MAEVNPFDMENARNLTISQVVDTFVAIPAYWTLFSSKNHIVLGSRGSGKTSIAKMLSHTHLTKFKVKNEKAAEYIDNKKYIGIYIPMSAEWLGGINNKHNAEYESVELFQWKLNIKTCLAFTDTIKSCIEEYARTTEEKIIIEVEIVSKLKAFWFPDDNDIKNIKEVQDHLGVIDFDIQVRLAKERILGRSASVDYVRGLEFAVDLFAPLKKGINILSQYFGLETSSWFICLDEAEILTSAQQKIINSYLRSCSGNLFFKIITMPYAHTTRETNVGANLNAGDDFEYVYIDNESPFIYTEQSLSMPEIIIELFKKRASSYEIYKDITIQNLLGESTLLDKHTFDNNVASKDMQLLMKYTDSKTLKRATDMLNEKRVDDFNNQIGRKMRGLLYLKDNVANARGRTKIDVYSGARMIVQCTDGNPRRLIRLFKVLLNAAQSNKKSSELPRAKQSEILMNFSESILLRVQSEEKIGTQLYDLLRNIGNNMKSKVHDTPLTTEQIYSIKLNKEVSDEQWQMIKRAVANGLIYPTDNASYLQYKEGTYRLAYVLCPYFLLLPRKGQAVSLNRICGGKSKPRVSMEDGPNLFSGTK